MGMAHQVSGLYYWLYLKYELMELTDFLHTDAISHKLKGD